jgi:hypothetical protein
MLKRKQLVTAAVLIGAVVALGLPYPQKAIVFEPVSNLRSPLQRVPIYFGGKPLDPADEYPASLFAELSAAWCSATLVGEDSLLTARHCTGWGDRSERTIIGVNKCGGSYGVNVPPATSVLTASTNPSIAEWIANWARAKQPCAVSRALRRAVDLNSLCGGMS